MEILDELHEMDPGISLYFDILIKLHWTFPTRISMYFFLVQLKRMKANKPELVDKNWYTTLYLRNRS